MPGRQHHGRVHALSAHTRSPAAPERDGAPDSPARAGGGESGFILVMTLLVLAVLIALVGAVGVSSVNVGNTSSQVTLRNRAYAVANAGVQTALFRLNATGGTTGATGSVTNGASYSYTVSALSQGDTCAGLWVKQTGSGQPVQEDCITATGTVGSFSVKVQDRVVAYTPVPSAFPVNGIFAINGFSVGQNFTDTAGDIASNGQITFGSGASVTGKLEYLQQYPPAGITCTNTCTPVIEQTPLTLASTPATADAAYGAAATTNNDNAISPAAWTAAGYTYTPATHQILGGNGNANTITFQPGTYYYCDFSADTTNGVELDSASSATAANPVIIYIDSPSRNGSSCAPGTGNFAGGKNTMVLNNLSGIGSAFQIYIHGTPGCTTNCPIILSKNSGTYSNVEIYAPYSQLNSKNNTTLTGDFVVGSLNENQNGAFTFLGPVNGPPGNGKLASYFPAAQQICTTGSTC